ncbi:DUF4114 domain-containing protein [Roseomonas terrae]|jgi:hypothetical protein|uniref:DUF4114 domain-containing protein n=1 Tax=Neoroseomonas terrae TaxID=424799 RepID=A0ABS5EKK2_9PROT|nr:VCBS repeat-containing protein [Neoroseomonas terrae]MBR0651547.1 DUF4114 domain-containing protein [Neoroseomonas terrae]
MGLNTLSDTFTIGVRASSSGLDYGLQQSMQESYTIRSVTGGQYRSGTAQQDLVFLQYNQGTSSDTDIHFRTFDTGSGTFNGSLVTTIPGQYNYASTADLNNDGFGDLVLLNSQFGTLFDRWTQTTETPPTLTLGMLIASPGDSMPFNGGDIIHSSIPADGSLGAEVAITDFDFADFNHDGILDIIVAGVAASKPLAEAPSSFDYDWDGVYSIGLGNGSGSFDFQPLQKTGTVIEQRDSDPVLARVAAMDMNDDGYVDVAFAYHLEDNDELPSNVAGAYVVWGDANSSSGTPSLTINMTDSSSVYATYDWNDPQDVIAIWQSPAQGPVSVLGNLGVARNGDSYAALFNYSKTVYRDDEINNTPRSPFGPAYDYDGDGLVDLMYVDGNSSAILTGYNWSVGDPAAPQSHTGITLGTDIFSTAALDFNGDGKMDWAGGYNGDNHIYAYVNLTQISGSDVAVELTEGEAVRGTVNGVAAHRMMGSDFTVSVIGGQAAYDNALGWFELRADGTFGDAQFVDIADGTFDVAGLGAGSRLALFLVSNGAALNEDLTGGFRFVDAATGAPARLGSVAPTLVSADRPGQAVEGEIFHTADANTFDMVNPLNTGGLIQTLSRVDADGSLMIGFEDLLLMQGDADFNDLLIRVTSNDDIIPV